MPKPLLQKRQQAEDRGCAAEGQQRSTVFKITPTSGKKRMWQAPGYKQRPSYQPCTSARCERKWRQRRQRSSDQRRSTLCACRST